MEQFDILTLDDNKNYSLLQTVEYEGESYCLLVEVDQEDNPMEHVLILRKILLPDNQFEFEELEDEEYQKVSEIFQSELMKEEE